MDFEEPEPPYRNYLGLAVPDGTDLEVAFKDGEVDVRADPEDWQVDLAEADGAILLWWDLDGDEPTTGAGMTTGKIKDGFVEVRPLTNPRKEISLRQLIGAVDFSLEMRYLGNLDGCSLDDAASIAKNDQCWVITTGPLLTYFKPERWITARARKQESDQHESKVEQEA